MGDTAVMVEATRTINALLHALADVSAERGRLAQVAQANRRLLVDALHALQHDRPHITEEYLERCIAALDKVR